MILLNKNIKIYIFLKYYLIFVFILLFISCNNDTDYNFNKLVSIKENTNENILKSVDLNGIENIENIYYKRLPESVQKILQFLVTQRNSQ